MAHTTLKLTSIEIRWLCAWIGGAGTGIAADHQQWVAVAAIGVATAVINALVPKTV